MRVLDCKQGTAEWLDVRRGKITASRICDVMDKLKKGGEGAARRGYRTELIAERLSGLTEEHYTSNEMMHGTEFEPFARAAYEIGTGADVDQVGFVLHDRMDFAGASPDGIVGPDGAIEIKCPKTTTHIKWVLAGGVPEEHQDQCLWVMACTGAKWIDFISFDPRLPEGLRIFMVRMPRDEERIARIEAEVEKFDAEVNASVSELSGRVGCINKKEKEQHENTECDWQHSEGIGGTDFSRGIAGGSGDGVRGGSGGGYNTPLSSFVETPTESAPPIEQWPEAFDSVFSGDVSQ